MLILTVNRIIKIVSVHIYHQRAKKPRHLKRSSRDVSRTNRAGPYLGEIDVMIVHR